MSKLIYLDNAATTRVKKEVLDAMLPYFTETYSNPSAVYSFASEGKKAVMEADGYLTDYFPEDYFLWIRMLMNGCKFYNIQE